ncbi:SCAN domain-containing 3-like isoform X2 [Labeo rohita]|uniref:SCAN domain-containing 3-like isoform X2 n=1 Tax=Labeo rohita TaxID=84645 RepID=A0A498M1D8_LABRO|nr:SCAN domain-containing 3-like isoform X2 [Labeo rohita]
MALSKTMKRKVDVENWSFNDDWTEKYAFIMPTFRNASPVCLICSETVAVAKEYNLRRHHNTKHSNFKVSYPEQSEARQRKIATLKSAYSRASGIITRTLTDQERVTCASLQAAWVLCRHNRPFTESEVLKECMITVLEELAPDKSMDRIIASVKQVPLSASTNARRVHVLAEQVQKAVIDGVKEAKYFSLAIDESTDNTDISQLCVFVRYFDGKDFREELLALLPLEDNTTADIIFGKLEDFFKSHGLPLDKINLTVTDGAPAMIGKNKGLVSRIRTVAPKTNALHCIIHQSVLCAKLSGELKEVMEKTMKIINHIRETSSTQHRLFRKFVLESQASHDDLLLHNDVRWLSKGKALERFVELRAQVVDFLKQSKSKAAADHLRVMQDTLYVCNVAFLTDIFSHLNTLNLQLQGKGKSVVDLVEKLDAFGNKLNLFHADLLSGRLLHFNTLKTVGEGNVTDKMKTFITQLKDNFSARFDDFFISRDVIGFVRDPFTISPSGEFSTNAVKMLPLDEAAIQSQLAEIQAAGDMKAALRGAESLSAFWVSCPETYDTLKTLAMYVLTMFGSTYTCEAAFSKMNSIKTHERNRLSTESLEDCLRISLTAAKPDVKKLVSEGKCNFSH